MEALGINLINIIIYTVLFVVVYLVLKKYLLSKLMEMIEKRQKTVKDTIELKNNLQKEQEELESKQKEVIAETRAAAKEELAQMRKEAEADKLKLLQQAKTEAQEIIAKAEKRLAQEREKMTVEMNEKVELAVKKVVQQIYQQDKVEIDKKLIDLAVKDLQ